ncbi:hypothetical protein AKJ60_00835 [candidate division MSBL1 archaeon SCGC-AAA385M11]|nr:hypothetical protein AKJ60_00835 [candidate division MSBL1 archaeon SCGC-AAA385M11]
MYVELEKKQVAQVQSGGTARAGDTWTEPVTGMEFVWVPGGCYQMGSENGDDDEEPVHEVCVDGFWMGKYEVIQGEWEEIMGNNPSRFDRGDNYPVERVSWNDCQDFIEKLNRRSNGNFRLPTEAEWEYAARAGTKTARYWGDGIDCSQANYGNGFSDACKGKNPGRTTKVGSYSVNTWGLYDMLGNVWEWCADWYDSDAYSQHSRNNPIYDSGGSYRVRRGGSWSFNPSYVRCANRSYTLPGDTVSYLGFRLYRTR